MENSRLTKRFEFSSWIAAHVPSVMPLIFVEFIIRENRTNVTRVTRKRESITQLRIVITNRKNGCNYFFTTRVCIEK